MSVAQGYDDADKAEARRLAAVHKYDILDTPPDGCFDRVTAIAAKLFSAPISIVSLVDSDRIWFKSRHGLDVEQIDRAPGLCASAILQDTPYIVEDAASDLRTLSNPLVAGDFGLKFYAAVPLRTSDGHNLGTLCVIDREPRKVAPEQIEHLEHLASLVMDQMELRLEARRAVAEIEHVTKAAAELSGRREEEARRTSALLTAIGASSPNPIYAKDTDLRFIYANEAMLAVLGRSAEQVLGSTIEQVIPRPEEAQGYVAANLRILAQGRVEHVEEAFTRDDGTRVFFQSSMAPLRSSDGEVVGIVGVSIDVTDRKRAEEHQRLLINELNHRVKNTLAVVQGIAHQTFRASDDSSGAKAAFEGRLAALSSAHTRLTDESWDSASMRQIVDDALEPFNTGEHEFVVAGPDVRLSPKTAVTLALAVHELATNAAKYGALCARGGGVELKWWSNDGRLKLVWRERGGPPVLPPARRGFGTKMIERGLAAELGGKVTIDFAPDGIVCEVDAPLPELSLGSQPEGDG